MPSSETDAQTKANARRLLDSDGPGLRNWARTGGDEFVQIVHDVAKLALSSAPRPAPGRTTETRSRRPQAGSGDRAGS